MRTYPLIVGSICVVVLLVLGSLSNVVGYQSVKSTVNDSPLFQTRTQRATNQQQNIITSRYLGIGKHNLLQFPVHDNRTEQLKKAIEILSKMDDKTFERFTELVIQRSKQDETLRNLNQNVIIHILSQLRTKSITLLKSPVYKNDYQLEMPNIMTMQTGCWFLFFIIGILMVICYIPLIIFDAIVKLIYNIIVLILDIMNAPITYYFCPMLSILIPHTEVR